MNSESSEPAEGDGVVDVIILPPGFVQREDEERQSQPGEREN
jgi:hypothetical protein